MNEPSRTSWHGLDKHILATLLHRSWTVMAGGITVLLIPLCLDRTQQGYYFAFSSILALQIFFELGMGQIVIQIAAHEAAHLQKTVEGTYEGDVENVSRLCQLRAQLRRWYFPAAVLFATIVSTIGLMFFDNRGLTWSQWGPAWLMLVGATAVNLNLSWKISMIEGFGLVQNVAQIRLKQSIIGYTIFWCGLLGGLGLWVTIVIPITAATTTTIWLKNGATAAVFRLQSPHPPSKPISWAQDILPFQWRIAISWVSGYFIFQLFTPLIFRQAGAVEAGRLGLAITIFNAIGVIGLSWVNAKAPQFSMMIARRESSALLKEFKSVALRSLLATAAISGMVILSALGATLLEMPLMQRVADLPVLACLAIVTVVNSVIFSAAIFMRSHLEEPMLANSVVNGILIAIASWYGSKYGSFEMMFGYAAVCILVALPWTLWIFSSYVRRHK